MYCLYLKTNTITANTFFFYYVISIVLPKECEIVNIAPPPTKKKIKKNQSEIDSVGFKVRTHTTNAD